MWGISSYFNRLLFVLIISSLFNISCSGVNFGDSPSSEALKEKGVLINEGVEYTNNLNVQLKLNGGYAQKVRISSKSDCSDGVWEDFLPAQIRNWTLPSTGNRTKHVYVKYAQLDDKNLEDPKAQDPNNPEVQTECFSDSIIYDNTPPKVVITNKKMTFSNAPSLEIRFQVEDDLSGIDKTLCALDNGKSKVCEQAITYNKLSEKNHTVEVVTFDKAGNSSKPAFYSWSVDRTPPRVSIVSKPALRENREQARFTFNIEDQFSGVDKIECALDGGAYTECSRNYSASQLKEGAHRIHVKAFDVAGNENKKTSYEWTIDRTGPSIEWVSQPPAFVSAKKPSSFVIKAQDQMSKVKTILCQLDGGSFSPCQERFTFSNLSHGSHKVVVKALDELDNPSKLYTHSWKVDDVPPTVTIDKERSVKNWVKRESQAKVYFSAVDKDSGIDKILCSHNGTKFGQCSSPVVYNRLLKNSYELHIKAVDKVGKQSQVAVHQWNVDGGNPEVIITRRPEKITNQAQAIFEFEGTDQETEVTRFECEVTLEGKSVQKVEDCKSGYTFAQTKGRYLFSVKAFDAVGNSSAPATYEWTVDRQGPQIEITAPKIVFIGDKSQIQFKPSIGTRFEEIDRSSVRCYHNDVLVAPCILERGIRLPNVQLGESRLRVELSDRAGNPGESSFQWLVERRYVEKTHNLTVDETDYQVDIVFVVDNSQSMNQEHRGLSEKINGFMNIISGLDYHIGLITTDVGQSGRGRGSLFPIVKNQNIYFIDSGMPFEEAQRLLSQSFIKVGTGGDSTELGFSTVYNLLTRDFNSRRYKKNIYMRDFLRDKAMGLVVIIISDEDQSQQTYMGNQLLRFVKNKWPRKKFVWHSLVVADEACKKREGKRYGEKYMELSKATGGIIGSVCSDNYANELEEMAEEVTYLRSIDLGCEPVDGDRDGTTLQVLVHKGNAVQPHKNNYAISGSEVLFEEFFEPGQYSIKYQCYVQTE